MKNNLPCWKRFSEYLKSGKKANDFDLICKDGEISRINARYRLAISFEGLSLNEYSDKTVLAYSSIIKVFLTYSVFENYIKCIYGKNRNIVYEKGSLVLNNGEEISNKILQIDKNKTFYKTLKKFLNETHNRELDKFYNNENHNLVYLFSSIRHAFVHGKLTPHFDKNSSKVIKICYLLSEYVLKQIADDFAKRICSE